MGQAAGSLRVAWGMEKPSGLKAWGRSRGTPRAPGTVYSPVRPGAGKKRATSYKDNAKLCFIFISLISTKADSVCFIFFSFSF